MGALVTWLGQSGFVVEAGGRRLLIDPFLSEHPDRAYPPPPLERHAAGCEWLLITHEHLDHLDAGALPRIAAVSPGLTVVAPAPLAGLVEAAAPGVAFRGVRPGDVLELPGIGSVRAVPAIHGVEPADAYTDGSADGGPPRFVGYVVEAGGVALYHAGDTIATDAVLAGLAGIRVDVALLPVNGRSYFREQLGLVGNLDPREAVELARRIGAATLVPCHWDGFAANGERAGAAADEAAATGGGLHVLVLAREVPWPLTQARSTAPSDADPTPAA